ncbi:MAG TPA: HEAT repeat domain-containing protein [Clostridia bacterium]|nr:HEAT repeat domain-containing protein [Clostridia bacterium]
MNCEWVKDNVTLYLYDELPDDARHELEQHVGRCRECAAELEGIRKFHGSMNQLPQLEVTPNLLASARMRLQEELETTEQAHGWRRFTFDPFAWLAQVRFSPALATVIFIVGFGGGVGTMYRMAANGRVAPTVYTPEQHTASAISGIRSVTQQPGSDNVQIQYEKTIPQQMQGSVNDPEIQELLLYASRSNFNSGVRMDSIDLLTQKPDDARVREALVFALRYDSNPGVRLKAMEGLANSVKQDIRVRNAILEALLNDNNPGVRSGALHALEPVKADTSVRQALQQLAQEDPSTFIRGESRRLLASLPQID